MAALQTPEFVIRNGDLVPWGEATLHIGCEGVNRGLSIFEGLKGYWQADGAFRLLKVREHYARLLRSARLMHIPCPWSYEQFCEDMFKLVGALISSEKDMWVRTTMFVVEGSWGEGTRADMLMTAYHQDKALPDPVNIGVSTWQRSADNALPYRVKSAANYQVGRLARIEGRERGCQDMVLLNSAGRVAEFTGSALLMVRGDAIITPSHCEGALESITVDCAEAIARSMDVQFVRRPVDRTELYVADEISLCGTLTEMIPAGTIDGFDVNPDGPVLGELRRRFMSIVRGESQHEEIELTRVKL